MILGRQLNAALLGEYGTQERTSYAARLRLIELLRKGDLLGLRELFHSFYASIHQWYTNNTIALYEGFYVSVFYSYFAAQGLDIRTEESTNHGRIDMAVLFADQVNLFEFKVVEEARAGNALQQIRDMGYADKYRDMGCLINLVGVEFSKKDRNIVKFEVETI